MVTDPLFYKLPHLSREEIQAMLQVDDIRKTRVFQEAKEEGVQEGIEQQRQRSLQEKLRAVARLAALNLPAEQIAEIQELDLETVRRAMAGADGHDGPNSGSA